MTDQALPLAASRTERRTGSFKVPYFIGRTITYLLLTTLVTQISNAVEYRFDVEGRNR